MFPSYQPKPRPKQERVDWLVAGIMATAPTGFFFMGFLPSGKLPIGMTLGTMGLFWTIWGFRYLFYTR